MARLSVPTLRTSMPLAPLDVALPMPTLTPPERVALTYMASPASLDTLPAPVIVTEESVVSTK